MEPFWTRRSTITLILIGFLSVALFVTLMVVRQSQELRKKAAAATALELVPQNNQINQSDEFTLDVVMRPGVNQVTSANITLTYDPSILQGISFTEGSLFPMVTTSGLAQNGQANIALSAPTTQPVRTEGVVATLRLKARNPTTSTSVVFDGSTIVTAIGESGNVVTSAREASVVVNQTVNPSTDLGFVPSNITLNPNEEFTLDIEINTGVNQITSTDILINYDTSFLEGVRFVKGPFLSEELRAGSFANGVARITLGNGTTQKSGTGVVAKLTMRAKISGNTTLVMSSQSVVKAVGTDENMLRNRGTANVIVRSVSGSPQPTPVATPLPRATPFATPQSTPLPAQTPAATPVNQPSATPGTGGACVKNAPLPPAGVTATATGLNEIVLGWNESLYATHYGIVYGRAPGRYEYGAPNVGYTSVLPIRGLTPNTTYYFAVFAVNDCAASGYSIEISAKTPSSGSVAVVSSPRARVRTATPLPDPTFVPLPVDSDPIPFLSGESGVPDPTGLPPIYLPPEPSPAAATKGFSLDAFLSPLAGVLLIIAAIFLGLFFIRLRAKPQ